MGELQEAFQIREIKDRLISLGVPHNVDAQGFMYWLDISGDGRISFEELVDGLVALEDCVKPKDFLRMHMWLDSTSRRVKILEQKMMMCHTLVKEVHTQFLAAIDALLIWNANRDHKLLLKEASKLIKQPNEFKAGVKLAASAKAKRLKETQEKEMHSSLVRDQVTIFGRLANWPQPPAQGRIRPPIPGAASASDDDEYVN